MHEAFRVLKPSRIFRIVTPDMDLFCDMYKRGDYSLINKVGIGETTERRFVSYFSIYALEKRDFSRFHDLIDGFSKEDFFNYFYVSSDEIDFSCHSFNTHINWFNYDKLKRMALSAGFSEENVHPSRFKQSISSEMRKDTVFPGFGFDMTHPEVSLYVDLKK